MADIVLVALLLSILIFSLLLNDRPAISATDNSYHSNHDYAQAIRADFAGATNRNKLTFNEAKVVERIDADFPEVSAASIELPFFSEQPKVRLLVSAPAFKLKSHSHLFIVNQQGVVVTTEVKLPQFAKLPTVDDQSGFEAAVGKQVLSSQAAGFISTVILQSQRAKVPLSALTLPAVPLEFDLRTSDQPYTVKFYLNGDANTETGQFLAARQKFTQSHITPTQYLDVRVSGKIFYK